MLGVICKRDILAHPLVVIHCFGWTIFLRALAAGQNETFLSVLARGTPIPDVAEVPRLVGRCVGLELRAMQIYQALAQRFGQTGSVRQFFDTIARQEQRHAELVDLCRTAAVRAHWEGKHFEPWRDAVPRLERQLKEAESSLDSLDRLVDALRLVIKLESSGVQERTFLACGSHDAGVWGQGIAGTGSQVTSQPIVVA